MEKTPQTVPSNTGTGARFWVTPKAGQPYENYFKAATAQYSLPTGLLSRVAYQESRYNPKAINTSSNARGMMQIVPRWHPTVKNPHDPVEAIPYAAKYLRQLYTQLGTWSKALAGYNWGPGNVSKAIDAHGAQWLQYAPLETRNYVSQITRDTGVV